MNTFLIADTHFSHSNILNFKDGFGNPLRSFWNVHEMDEHMIDRWNKTVGPNDKVYHLGDVGFSSFSHLKLIFDRLNGEKVLIKGNHDNLKLSQYAQMFKDVRATHVLDKLVLSHVPLHPSCLDRWRGNIHGHLHSKMLPDWKYFNVSVELLDNYAPKDFESIRAHFSYLEKEKGVK